MTRNVCLQRLVFATALTIFVGAQSVQAGGSGRQAVAEAAKNNQFSFIMFYRARNASVQQMHRTVTSALSANEESVIVPVQVGDPAEAELVKKFDATRLPMPALAVLAPNGAVCSVIPRRVTERQVVACLVSPAQAECLKALQDNRIVALCTQPTADSGIPQGVRQFEKDELVRDRMQVITVLATDPKEAPFLKQLRVPAGRNTPVVALMAPPGVMVGVFNSDVTHMQLSQKLIAAGKCCDDENCKHRRSAARNRRSRR